MDQKSVGICRIKFWTIYEWYLSLKTMNGMCVNNFQHKGWGGYFILSVFLLFNHKTISYIWLHCIYLWTNHTQKDLSFYFIDIQSSILCVQITKLVNGRNSSYISWKRALRIIIRHRKKLYKRIIGSTDSIL